MRQGPFSAAAEKAPLEALGFQDLGAGRTRLYGSIEDRDA